MLVWLGWVKLIIGFSSIPKSFAGEEGNYYLLFHESNGPMVLRYGAGDTYYFLSVTKSIKHNYVNLQSPIYPSVDSHVIRLHSVYLHA